MKDVLCNTEIKANKVRLVPDNTMLLLDEALRIADAQELDLIQISENNGIAIVTLGDYNKYMYELKQKEKESKKKSKLSQAKVKIIKFTSNTQINDINVKFKNIQSFISKGNHVKIEMFHISRSRNTKEGIDILTKHLSLLKGFEYLQSVKVVGSTITCTIKAKNENI